MKNIAGSVLLRHRLAVAPGHRVEQKMSLTLFMKHGLRMEVRPRDLAPVIYELRAAEAATRPATAPCA
uniref:Uncharacterized protein n=1 Tax=Arundo donax TaxID=35708 RepID=A0A0A9EYX8_ARUDO